MSNYKSITAIKNAEDFDNTFTAEYGGQDATNVTILTPTSGTKLAIKGVYIGSTATTGEIRLTIDSNTVCTFFANSQAGYVPVRISGLRNSVLKLTTTISGANAFVLVNYREE